MYRGLVELMNRIRSVWAILPVLNWLDNESAVDSVVMFKDSSYTPEEDDFELEANIDPERVPDSSQRQLLQWEEDEWSMFMAWGRSEWTSSFSTFGPDKPSPTATRTTFQKMCRPAPLNTNAPNEISGKITQMVENAQAAKARLSTQLIAQPASHS